MKLCCPYLKTNVFLAMKLTICFYVKMVMVYINELPIANTHHFPTNNLKLFISKMNYWSNDLLICIIYLPSLWGPAPRLLKPLRFNGPPKKKRSFIDILSCLLNGVMNPFENENCVVW